MPEELPGDLARAVELGGEMGRRFAELDWSAHPLGHPRTWSAEIRAITAVALTSRFPIIMWLGADDLFQIYNDAYIPALGERHPAALGARGREVWWDIWDEIGPMLSGVLTTGVATWSADLMLLMVADGRRVERYWTFSYSPIITGSGKPEGIFCAVAETTERVIAARRLGALNAVAGALMETHTPEQAVAALVQACGDDHPDLPFVAVYQPDPDTGVPRLVAASGRVHDVLPRRLAGWAGSATGVGELIDDLPGRIRGLAARFGESCPEQALLVNLADTGSPGALLFGLNPSRPLDEQYRGFCRLLTDQLSAALATAARYQEQRQRAEALAELDRAKTAFLANISHEFRTPLTLLLGPLDDAIAEADGRRDRERLQLARRNAGRLLRLVNALLDFSRIEAGRISADPRPVDVAALTARIASSFAEPCQRAGLQLVIDCQPVIGEVDPAMWETIVLNLLSNALKYTLDGSVTVAVQPVGEQILMRVTDTGIGIDPVDLPRLTERFYRAANTGGRSVEGSGIGLSMVDSLVALHHGRMRIDSRVGEGTTVTVELPRPSDPGVPVAPLPAAPSADNPYLSEALQWVQPPPGPVHAGPHPRRRPLVLVVDDNPDMRGYLQQIVAQRWDAAVAADGRSALESIRATRPDLVITDVMMPGVDGFGLVNALRAEPELAALPVLMLSARAGAEAAGEGLASGADDYLSKPFSSTELLQRVQARLDGAARHEENRLVRGRVDAVAARVTAALGAAESLDDVLAALTADPDVVPGAVAAVLGVVEGDHLVIHHTGAIPAELRERYHRAALSAPVPLAAVVRTGQPMIVPDVRAMSGRFKEVADDFVHVRACQLYPLRDASGAPIGALALTWDTPQEFSSEALLRVEGLAARVGSAVTRIRAAQREHRIATDFQEHLLDLDRRTTAVALAALYQPAAEAMRVGGDWYLSVPLPEPGRIALSVGDVVGHGLSAATVMGRLRAVLTASALTDPDPMSTLAGVERYASTVTGARFSTLAYALLDTSTGTLDYTCAGHPYPLVVGPDGAAGYLTRGRQSPLASYGVRASGADGHADLPPGSLLILYTDGLIERRGESLDRGLERLAEAARECRRLPVAQVCHRLRQRLAPSGGYQDDLAILAVRPAGVTPDSFVTALAARPPAMAAARHALDDWLATLDLPVQLRHDVILSVGEALTNAIQHGSSHDPDTTVSIEAFADDSALTVAVSDTGRWSSDSAASRREARGGRGLTIMHRLAARVETLRTTQGSQVTLRFARTSSSTDTGALR